jgi:hypothetical protein
MIKVAPENVVIQSNKSFIDPKTFKCFFVDSNDTKRCMRTLQPAGVKMGTLWVERNPILLLRWL